MVGVPLTLLFGIIGLFADERKVLALVTTLISGALVGLWLFFMVLALI